MATRRVAIVPHTHWDREWYEPYQTFRLRLVDTVDSLLSEMESDPSYGHFLLDGQMAVVDDYLEIRPNAAESIRRLAVSGRLAMGPWYILMDEFLVSGETIVRNLQLGLESAARFGSAMEVGYLPDMFGHIAQMPQILSQAGFEHAVVWRGVPSAIDRNAFVWSAPDGSSVRAEYLVCGYGNGAAIPTDPDALVRRLEAHEDETSSFLLDSILFMNGTDHQAPQPWLGAIVDKVNATQDHFELMVTSLAQHLQQAPKDDLVHWEGELRSGARANLLMGVASNRVDVKQAAARAERELERRAEPLSALFVPPPEWPKAQLDLAWREMIRNSAHDSICACSVDDVVDAVLVRYSEARHIAEGLTERALRWASISMAEPGSYVINPTPRPTRAIVEILLDPEDQWPGAQPLKEAGPAFGDLELGGAELGAVLGLIRSQEVLDGVYLNSMECSDVDDGIVLDLHLDSVLRSNFLVETAKRDLYARIGRDPSMRVHIRSHQKLRKRVLVQSAIVPGMGWRALAPGPLANPVEVQPADADGSRGPVLSNGLVRVEIDPTDGTFALNGLSKFDRLVDSGDHGDTYNYSPPDHDQTVDNPLAVAIDLIESGPVRSRVRITRTFAWPEAVDESTRTRTGSVTVEVRTLVELQAGSELVRVTTSFDNRCRDHRLRTVFPLPTPASVSLAECAFATIERGLYAEGGPTETGLATYPSRRFVQAGGITVIHEGLLEYELTDIDGGVDIDPGVGIDPGVDIDPGVGNETGSALAHTLSLTLLRSTGMLSRVTMAYRPLPAGPPIALKGSQMQGPVKVRYALAMGDIDPYAAADDAFGPLSVVHAPGGGTRPASGSALEVTGAEVSSIRRSAGAVEVRVFNPSSQGSYVSVPGRSGWLVNLRGKPTQRFDSGFELRPWGFETIRLDEINPTHAHPRPAPSTGGVIPG